jgi:m7GpppX diphosphatase
MKKPFMRKYRANQIIESETYQQYLERIYRHNNIKDSWIYDILADSNHKEIMYTDDKFVMIKPTKSTDVHMLAFVRDVTIRSLRDLDKRHIPLLEHIYDAGCKFFESVYGINRNKLKAYIHYPPTTWVLHVHFNSIENNEMSSSVEYSHSIHEVINILTMCGDYYQSVAMKCLVNE